MSTATGAGVSLRAFATSIGVSHTSVAKAIRSGRLSKSVARDAKGSPRIADPDLARAEWSTNTTRPKPLPKTAPPVAIAEAAASARQESKPEADTPPADSLVGAQLRVAQQRALALSISNDQRQGRLVEAATARREAFECARTVRDAILNVPDRIAAELAAETDPGRLHARLGDELRKALEVLAEVFAHGD